MQPAQSFSLPDTEGKRCAHVTPAGRDSYFAVSDRVTECCADKRDYSPRSVDLEFALCADASIGAVERLEFSQDC